jgi:hypothetical protein
MFRIPPPFRLAFQMPWLLGISMAAGCGGTSSGSGAHGQEDSGGKHPTSACTPVGGASCVDAGTP